MKSSRNGLRPSYIPPYSRRKDFCRKIRQIEKEIQNLKDYAYKNNVRSSKKTIKWRPEYGEYMSDFDYKIRLLQEARKL